VESAPCRLPLFLLFRSRERRQDDISQGSCVEGPFQKTLSFARSLRTDSALLAAAHLPFRKHKILERSCPRIARSARLRVAVRISSSLDATVRVGRAISRLCASACSPNVRPKMLDACLCVWALSKHGPETLKAPRKERNPRNKNLYPRSEAWEMVSCARSARGFYGPANDFARRFHARTAGHTC
jgi:hypothetical protein